MSQTYIKVITNKCRIFLSDFILYQCCASYSKKELHSLLHATLTTHFSTYKDEGIISHLKKN